VVFDGRNLYEPAGMVAFGLESNCIRRLRLFRAARRLADWRPGHLVAYLPRISAKRSGWRSSTLSSFTSASGGLVLPFS